MSSLCSSDPYRRVHSHPSLSSTAVPWVCRRGRRGLESWSANGRLPYRGVCWTASWNLYSVLPSLSLLEVSLDLSSLLKVSLSVSFCIWFLSLFQVNGQNVVKVGHRQVVNMIRQGGNSLMVKVVMVTRNPDMEEGVRKKSKRYEFKQQRQHWSIIWWCWSSWHQWHFLSLSLSLNTVPQQSKRLSTPAIALRSKSMTSELEEMGKMWEMGG